MTNGGVNPILMWLISGLLGLVNVLLGLVLKAHKDSDDERHTTIAYEVNQFRTRLHDLSGTIGKIDQWQRFQDDSEPISEKVLLLDKAISDLTLVLHKDFVTKEEWEKVRTRLHDINDNVSALKSEWILRKLRREK